MIDKNLKIESKRIYLRRLKLLDAADICAQINDPDVVRWTTRIPYPYPSKAAAKYIRQSHYLWRKGSAYTLGIISRENNHLIGLISLSSVTLVHSCAELGFWLGKSHWNQGYMTEAVGLVVHFALKILGLNRIYASSFEANEAASKVLLKCGFQIEGILREAVFRENARQNYVNFGMIRSDLNR